MSGSEAARYCSSDLVGDRYSPQAAHQDTPTLLPTVESPGTVHTAGSLTVEASSISKRDKPV